MAVTVCLKFKERSPSDFLQVIADYGSGLWLHPGMFTDKIFPKALQISRKSLSNIQPRRLLSALIYSHVFACFYGNKNSRTCGWKLKAITFLLNAVNMLWSLGFRIEIWWCSLLNSTLSYKLELIFYFIW